MINLNDSEIFTPRQFMNPFFQPVHDFIVCIRCFSRYLHIKDQICSGRSPHHAEIMHTERFIQKMYHLLNFCLHRKDLFVIGYDQIHMNRCRTVQYFLQFMFNMIDLFMNILNISIHIHFSMK